MGPRQLVFSLPADGESMRTAAARPSDAASPWRRLAGPHVGALCSRAHPCARRPEDLRPLKISELRRRAIAEGLGADAVDHALDDATDPHGALITLIVNSHIAKMEEKIAIMSAPDPAVVAPPAPPVQAAHRDAGDPGPGASRGSEPEAVLSDQARMPPLPVSPTAQQSPFSRNRPPVLDHAFTQQPWPGHAQCSVQRTPLHGVFLSHTYEEHSTRAGKDGI